MGKTLGNVTGRATHGLRTAATATILGAALTAGFMVASNDSNPAHAPQPDAPSVATAPMVDTPREDVLTAIGLSDSWLARSAEWQSAACAEWVKDPNRVLATLQSNAAVLGQAFHAPTAAEWIDDQCFDLDANPTGEIGTAVSMEPGAEVGDGGAYRPAKVAR